MESFVVVFNGEIYNYPTLRTELEGEGLQFRTTSDTEVLLHLYARHGAEMVHRLRGMFAFAIWDETRRGLFLARDPYGIKPLYTANDGWTFRFASQVKALLAGGRVSRDPGTGGCRWVPPVRKRAGAVHAVSRYPRPACRAHAVGRRRRPARAKGLRQSRRYPR